MKIAVIKNMALRKLKKEKRIVLSRIFINLCGIVFGMLVIGPFVSGHTFKIDAFILVQLYS